MSRARKVAAGGIVAGLWSAVMATAVGAPAAAVAPTSRDPAFSPAAMAAPGRGPSQPGPGLSIGDAPLDGDATEPPVSAAALPRHRGTEPLLDDDPEIDLNDVVASVARATVAAAPWLHLGVQKADGAGRHRRAGPDDEAAERARQADLLIGGHAAPDSQRPPDQGGPRPPIDLAGELLELATSVLLHPVTWMLGFPLLLAGAAYAALRHRGK